MITSRENTHATIYVPAGKEGDVAENRREASRAKGVKFLNSQDGKAVYEVGPGSNTLKPLSLPNYASRECRNGCLKNV